jgi:hypothetical protein
MASAAAIGIVGLLRRGAEWLTGTGDDDLEDARVNARAEAAARKAGRATEHEEHGKWLKDQIRRDRESGLITDDDLEDRPSLRAMVEEIEKT